MDAMTSLVGKCFSDQIGYWCSEHRVEFIGHLMEHCDIDTELNGSSVRNAAVSCTAETE